MFTPNFRYTNRIVNNLVLITSAREIILNSYLVPKWEVSLRRDALIKAAHASTAIEGNPLTLEEVSQLAEGRKGGTLCSYVKMVVVSVVVSVVISGNMASKKSSTKIESFLKSWRRCKLANPLPRPTHHST